MTLTILKRGVAIEECSAQLEGNFLSVKVTGEAIFEVELYSEVDGKNMTVTCTPAKVEDRRRLG